MNKTIKRFLKYCGFIVVLVATIVFGCRCTTTKSDPLAGFHVSSLGNLDANKTIADDYKDYIQKLPAKQKGYIGTTFFYENEAGQHAVSIQIFEGNKNASWQHVLIYDKDNKRIKMIRYDHVKYQS